jgi:hypothetical protein
MMDEGVRRFGVQTVPAVMPDGDTDDLYGPVGSLEAEAVGSIIRIERVVFNALIIMPAVGEVTVANQDMSPAVVLRWWAPDCPKPAIKDAAVQNLEMLDVTKIDPELVDMVNIQVFEDDMVNRAVHPVNGISEVLTGNGSELEV